MTTDQPSGPSRRRATFLGLVLLLAACGSASDADQSDQSVAAPTPPTYDAVEVVQEPSVAPPLQSEASAVGQPPESTAPPVASTTLSPLLCSASSATWDIGGRGVLVRIPATASSLPLVVALHGYKGTPEGIEYYSELNAAAVSGEAVVAYLSGGKALDLGFGWNSGSSRFATTGVDDVAYISAALDQLGAIPCVDPAKTSLVGESNGGGMAVRAVCDERMSSRVQRLVLVNAAIDEGVLENCSAVEPSVEVLATAGLVDSVVPSDGSRDPFLAVDDWFPRVGEVIGGCDPTAWVSEIVSATVRSFSSDGCSRCVTMLEVSDGGHTWPGSFEGSNDHPVGSLEFTTLLRRRIQSDGVDGAAGEGQPASTCL